MALVAAVGSAAAQTFPSQGVTLPLGTPEEFSAFVAAESSRWREIVRIAAIRME